MTVRLGFAVAAHLEPEILVVDEVLAVGDAEFQKKAIGKMQDLSQGEGRTVLFVSHNMASIQNLCTRAVLLDRGENVYDGSASEVVDYYISGKRSLPKSEVIITNKHRRFKSEDSLMLKSIILVNSTPSIRGELLFQVIFDVNSNINEDVCCTGSVCSLDDSRIGSFFSNSFQPILGTNKFELVIPNHNLAPGSYYLNLSISSGNVRNDNLKMLDHAYESISFDISKERQDTVHLTQWNSNWGKIFLQSQLILKND